MTRLPPAESPASIITLGLISLLIYQGTEVFGGGSDDPMICLPTVV